MTTAVVTDSRSDGTGIGGLLRSELIKLTSTRMIIVLAIVAAATGVAGSGIYGALGMLVDSEQGPSPFSTTDFVSAIYAGSNQMARIVAIIAGAMAMGNEYRHKTLATSYLAVPRRIDLVLGKAVITFGYGLFLVLAATVLGFLTGLVFILAHHGSTGLDTAAGWQALAFNIITVGLWAMIGYGLGILIRNMIASVLIAVGFAYIVEPLLNLIFTFKNWTVPSNLMPSGATKAALGSPDLNGLGATGGAATWPALAGVLVLIGWAVIPAAIGCLATIRRDVD
jgi:hypothetical protein